MTMFRRCLAFLHRILRWMNEPSRYARDAFFILIGFVLGTGFVIYHISPWSQSEEKRTYMWVTYDPETKGLIQNINGDLLDEFLELDHEREYTKTIFHGRGE